MSSQSKNTTALLDRAGRGDQAALTELFAEYRERLKRMVRLRINRRLQGRIDDSDVLQETMIEVARKLPEYLAEPSAPFFLWLRHLTGLKLTELHRHHLGTRMRDADREVSIYCGALPHANSESLAAQLLGKLTSPSQSALKAEKRIRLQENLNAMDPVDREILALRHFEQLSNAETAKVLGLTPSGASARHMRAIKRLKDLLEESADLFEA
jgi:RNA polymerase sigma-70 factor (ECF subfamily)